MANAKGRLSPDAVREFETTQLEFGTRNALSAFVFALAADLLRDCGAKRVSVSYWEPERATKRKVKARRAARRKRG